MAKQTMWPAPSSGGGVLSKVVNTLILVSLAMLVVKYPTDAARWVTATLRVLWGVVGGIVTFLRQIHG